MNIKVRAGSAELDIIGWRIGEAADFLINLLAGKEIPSQEILRLADEAGIMSRTFERAKRIAKAKSIRKNNKWYMSVPEEMKGHTFGYHKPYQKEYLLKAIKHQAISTDWVSVVERNDDESGYKTDIPARASPMVCGLRVKVGMYEFEASENFPTDKLIELLRELAVGGE